MNINHMNRQIRDDMYSDMFPSLAHLLKNCELLDHKIRVFLVEKGLLNGVYLKVSPYDIRDKSFVRLFLVNPLSSILLSTALTSIYGVLGLTPIPGISFAMGLTLCTAHFVAVCVLPRLLILAYDLAYRMFYNEKYLLEKIKTDLKFFEKADPELRTNLEFILKAIDQNSKVKLPRGSMDCSFIQIRRKKKEWTNAEGPQPLANQYYYAGLKEKSKSQEVPEDMKDVNFAGKLLKLTPETLNEIIKWLKVSSLTRWSITSKKFKLQIGPVIPKKVNEFFKNEVSHIIKGIKMYEYFYLSHEDDQASFYNYAKFANFVKSHGQNVESHVLQVKTLAEIVEKLSEMMNSDFNNLPRESNILCFNRIERIRSSILYVLKQFRLQWNSNHSNAMQDDPLSYLALEVPQVS